MAENIFKVDRIASAYSKLRISGITVNPTPEDLELALAELEAMMAELEEGRNICMGYNFEVDPDPNSDLGVPQKFWNMINCNLAVRLIPNFNKDVPQALLAQASQSMSTASAISAADRVRQVQYPRRMPIGRGNSFRFNRWQRFYNLENLPPNQCATNIILIDDVNDYQESFRAYLNTDESISSYSIEADNGLTIESSSINDPLIDYRIMANSGSSDGSWQQVKIVVTTSEGRINNRLINFELRGSDTVNGTT